MSETTEVKSQKISLIARFKIVYNSRPNIDFRKIWPKTFILSLIILIIAGGAWGIKGLNLGIEFEGGVVWELRSEQTSVEELRDTLRPFGQGGAKIQSLSGNLYRVRAEVDITQTERVIEIRNALATSASIPNEDASYSVIGPSWGDEVAEKTRTALYVFVGVLALYIWVRLEWRMTLTALIAVGHDIVVTVGFYALFGLEVTPATLIAFLTILGYSLYDTLVVFDKIRENENRREQIPYNTLVSRSMNQVLMRSINTTITSGLPVAILLIVGRYILGAVTLSEFAIALLVGLLAGTYSSIFVATPLLAWLKGKQASGIAEIKEKAETKSLDEVIPLPIKKAKKGMLMDSRVVTKPQTIPRPRKKKK